MSMETRYRGSAVRQAYARYLRPSEGQNPPSMAGLNFPNISGIFSCKSLTYTCLPSILYHFNKK